MDVVGTGWGTPRQRSWGTFFSCRCLWLFRERWCNDHCFTKWGLLSVLFSNKEETLLQEPVYPVPCLWAWGGLLLLRIWMSNLSGELTWVPSFFFCLDDGHFHHLMVSWCYRGVGYGVWKNCFVLSLNEWGHCIYLMASIIPFFCHLLPRNVVKTKVLLKHRNNSHVASLYQVSW